MEKNMKFKLPQKIVHYDKHSDVLYLGMQKGSEEEFVEIAPGIAAELDENKNVIGVEIINASKIFKAVIKPLGHQIQQIKA